ncbi:MAG TPA: hypothetical protein VJM12_09540, partial [Pyrinomonadaceae bacterium]|nr:hypothetical protein [Pyrinomonadaceae bacterium]
SFPYVRIPGFGICCAASAFKLTFTSEVLMANGLAGRNIGMVLLGLWLILTGLLPLLNVNISGTASMALGVLAIVAGILILIRR